MGEGGAGTEVDIVPKIGSAKPGISIDPNCSTVVCDLFADDNSIDSRGTDVESVQCCLQEGLNDVSK